MATMGYVSGKTDYSSQFDIRQSHISLTMTDASFVAGTFNIGVSAETTRLMDAVVSFNMGVAGYFGLSGNAMINGASGNSYAFDFGGNAATAYCGFSVATNVVTFSGMLSNDMAAASFGLSF